MKREPESVVLERVGRNVTALRKSRGWDQARLAVFADVALVTLRGVESASTDYRISSLLQIAGALEIDPSTLMTEVIATGTGWSRNARREQRHLRLVS